MVYVSGSLKLRLVVKGKKESMQLFIFNMLVNYYNQKGTQMDSCVVHFQTISRVFVPKVHDHN